MSWMKGKSSGWTAFDLKQRQKQKQGLQSDIIEYAPFPPVSASVNTSLYVRGKLRRNHEPSEKSFSSVLLPPSKFPALIKNKDCGNRESGGGCTSKKPGALSLPVISHDLYLSHRKDALKMMRSASNYSRAAQNAFLRHDHASAKQHSEKAREDWLTAEKLNGEAAKKIIDITNKNNDIWKLDLHGLHATEAVQVLQERLQKIEGQFTVNRSVSPNRGRSKNVEEGMHCQRTSSTEPRNSLQVVTGIGKHSRGHASLPLAVKTFFEDNRYRFDDTRPGVITVRPKFRQLNI